MASVIDKNGKSKSGSDVASVATSVASKNKKKFTNTSDLNIDVYADTRKALKVGELYAGSVCDVLNVCGNMICIQYIVGSTGAYKVGWIDCSGKEVQ